LTVSAGGPIFQEQSAIFGNSFETLEGAMLTKEMMEKVVRSTYLARVQEDADAAASTFTDQATLQVSAATIPGFGKPLKGRETIRQALTSFASILKYENWTELALVVEGNKAAIRWQAKITCIETGRSHVFDCIDLVEFDGNQIASLYHTLDTAALAALLPPALSNAA
jgi:ketosteroid isomerase-like protein